jgi:glutathione synthase/RimK-type ligase-like ATP-grasp enzyme
MDLPRIAIATCRTHGDLKGDDELLREALAGQGVAAESVPWDRDEVDWAAFEACIVRSTWDYHEKHDRFLAWARRVEAATRLWNPAPLIAWNANKAYLRELGAAGVPTVPTVWLAPGSDADLGRVLGERGWDEAVVKPVVDLGAMNLSRVRRGDAGAQQALDKVLARQAAMVQPYLPSLASVGELSLTYIEGELAHAVRKRPAPGDFRVQVIWGGTVSQAEPGEKEIELGARVLAQLDEPPLYARVDLVADLHGSPCLIELELIEPNLYLQTSPSSAAILADAVARRLN